VRIAGAACDNSVRPKVSASGTKWNIRSGSRFDSRRLWYATTASYGYRVISEKGRKEVTAVEYVAAKIRRIFKREMFHPPLTDAARNAFCNSDYETVGFEALKAVESAVLTARDPYYVARRSPPAGRLHRPTHGPRQHARQRRSVPARLLPRLHHQTIMNVDRYPDNVPVPSFGKRMVCGRCGMVGADARPNWGEHRASGTRR
jgi:hypothetical protein